MAYGHCIALFGVIVSGQCLAADPVPADKAPAAAAKTSTDVDQIRQSAQAFAAAFNKHDTRSLAALWTADGDYSDESGTKFVGREAIGKAYAKYFASNPRVQIRVVVDSVRVLSDTAAIEDGRSFVEPPPSGAPGYGRYTAVHVKIKGQWLLASVRDTWQETPSAYGKLADLEWLIGTWIAEDHGARIESECRWIANKSFIERTFRTVTVDGGTSAGVQIIGWNAQTNCLQSWTFNPDGGQAVGRWVPTQNGWRTEVRGLTADGMTTTAVNTLQRLDDKAYVWHSTERSASGQRLPDSDEIIHRRKADSR